MSDRFSENSSGHFHSLKWKSVLRLWSIFSRLFSMEFWNHLKRDLLLALALHFAVVNFLNSFSFWSSSAMKSDNCLIFAENLMRLPTHLQSLCQSKRKFRRIRFHFHVVIWDIDVFLMLPRFISNLWLQFWALGLMCSYECQTIIIRNTLMPLRYVENVKAHDDLSSPYYAVRIWIYK